VVIKAGDIGTENPTVQWGFGEVAVIPTKFALIIGNSESMMDDRKLSFAASDSLIINNSLIENAGIGVYFYHDSVGYCG